MENFLPSVEPHLRSKMERFIFPAGYLFCLIAYGKSEFFPYLCARFTNDYAFRVNIRISLLYRCRLLAFKVHVFISE